MDTRRPCPCCGHLVFDVEDGWPGSYAICPVCFWEDDSVQFRWPNVAVGANRVSLVEAQRNFQAFGACDQRGRRFVRLAAEDEPVDPEWRPIDLTRDVFEGWAAEERRPWPEDRSVLCWWLPVFWGEGARSEPGADRSVVIDVASVRSELDLHALLQWELGFPAFYGMNWDAFWDAITGLVQMPRELRFSHWAELGARAPEAAAMLRRQLDRYAAASADFAVVYDQ